MSGKIIKIIGWAVLGITVILGLIFMFNDAPALQAQLDAAGNLPQDLKLVETERIATDWSGLIINYCYILLIACAAAAIGFAIYAFIRNTIDNPRSAIKPLIIIGSLALIVIVSYALASDSLVGLESIKSEVVTPGVSKWVDTSIYGMYIFLGATFLALIYAEISKAWK